MIDQKVSHYRIIEKLGEGGMGIVYKAQDLELDRTVVLKFLPDALSLNPDAKKRFIREAKMASALEHPNICTIYEIGTTDEGKTFIVMAYCEGESLQKKLAKESLSIKEAVNVATQIVQGLERASKFGIIHRDLKPANIIISPENRVKIIDFGLAKAADQEEITKKTSSIGTTAYMSPQQICAEKLDQRSDIWSLGVILYEMLSGKLPFTGEYEAAVIYSILSEDPTPVSEIRPEVNDVLSRIIDKALAKDPYYRYKSVKQLRNDLENFQSGSLENVSVLAEENKRDLRRGFRNIYKGNKLKIVSAIFLLVTLLLVFVWFFNRPQIQENMIVIDEISINNTSEKYILLKKMIEYLLTDDLLQSSTNKNILSRQEFKLLYPNYLPEKYINGNIIVQNIGYLFNVSISKPKLGLPFNIFDEVQYITKKFTDPSVLLTGKIDEISRQVLGKERKKSSFTKIWDAFTNFYRGELAWQKIDLPNAKRFYRSALDFDPQFVLAKLRLASALSYEGSYLSAQKWVNSIRSSLNMLSKIDSLRAEALSARVTDDFSNEIMILKKIYNEYPSKKETAYEVAEAYFRVSDIDKAIEYYEKALNLDQNYALAHNHLAYCYSHRGNHKKALQHFHIYVQLDETANSYDSLGEGFMAAGLLDSAQWALEKAIQLDPRLYYAYGNLFEIRIRQGKINEALSAANKYLYYTYDSPDTKARGLFFKGMANFCVNNLNSALQFCELALKTHDAKDVFSRNHELHWLLARIYLKLNYMNKFRDEVSQMERIIVEKNINSTNYQREIFKFYKHLIASQAARHGKSGDVKDIINLFNGQIKYKMKDWGSAFDLAFFNTSFADLLMEPLIARIDDAENCLQKALKYNPNYALAHYQLGKLNEKKKNFGKAKYHIEKFLNLWKDADENLPELIDGKEQLKKLKEIDSI